MHDYVSLQKWMSHMGCYPEFALLVAEQGSLRPGYIAREFDDYLKRGSI